MDAEAFAALLSGWLSRQTGTLPGALHCQKETARLIAEKGGDYFLQIKGNTPTLLDTRFRPLAAHPAAHYSPPFRPMTINCQNPAPQSSGPRYAGFFDCFNRQCYFEAHEVLEPLWLEQRGRPGAPFYKGLIQVAGAFVHLQKNRLDPAARLFRLAADNLRPFAPRHRGLNIPQLLQLIASCLDKLEAPGISKNPHDPAHPPTLTLEAA